MKMLFVAKEYDDDTENFTNVLGAFVRFLEDKPSIILEECFNITKLFGSNMYVRMHIEVLFEQEENSFTGHKGLALYDEFYRDNCVSVPGMDNVTSGNYFVLFEDYLSDKVAAIISV